MNKNEFQLAADLRVKSLDKKCSITQHTLEFV